MNFHYLSHGKFITGGFLHEKICAESLLSFCRKKGLEINFKIIREEQFFESFSAHCKLLYRAWLNANADINLLVSRYAFPALFKALLGKGKYLLVFHYEDKNDKQSSMLKWYYRLFFVLLNLFNPSQLAIVVVAPFWLDYFQRKCPRTTILYFPNLFDLSEYQKIKACKNPTLINLGQWSWKNDPEILNLATQLKQLGFSCYFSTNNPKEAISTSDYDIIFESRHDFLTRMASAKYTLALTNINEGWNRLAHESLLLGTPVIGFNRGGLGNLLLESNSMIVEKIEQVIPLVIKDISADTNNNIQTAYSLQKSDTYIEPMFQFLFK